MTKVGGERKQIKRGGGNTKSCTLPTVCGWSVVVTNGEGAIASASVLQHIGSRGETKKKKEQKKLLCSSIAA
jgi:hypothetical protein